MTSTNAPNHVKQILKRMFGIHKLTGRRNNNSEKKVMAIHQTFHLQLRMRLFFLMTFYSSKLQLPAYLFEVKSTTESSPSPVLKETLSLFLSFSKWGK